MLRCGILTNKTLIMEEIVIYEYQLETILEALRITSNIHNSTRGETCHDRQVRQAYKFAENALRGEHKTEVSYITGK
jgi:hypothetical protein